VLVLAGCGGRQNSLAPKSHQARDIASLWWWMFGISCFGVALIASLLLLAWIRRGRRGIGSDREGVKPGEKASTAIVLGLGVAMPMALIISLFFISDIFVMRTTQSPAASQTKMTIRVIGHEWYWEVRYPGTRAVTANEIHIPARTPILLQATTGDVIHSFWVPELNRKIDTIPERVNTILLYADKPGQYRGQCAEYCGLQHTHMSMVVDAQPPAQFRAWLANEARPARAPAGGLAARGERVFTSGACSSCHAIRGTSASGFVGPDLTHLASRQTLGALTVRNTPNDLADWITNSQHAKPGNQMPDIQLPPSQLHALVAYLDSLK